MSFTRQDWRARPAAETDIAALTAMLDSATRTFLDRPTTPAETADRLAVPGCVLDHDSLLVETPDADVLGFAQVFRSGPSDIKAFARVHPTHRARGIGTVLAEWSLARARQIAPSMQADRVRFSTTAWASDAAAPSVLREAGLRERRHFLRMVTELPVRAAPAEPAAGLAVDAYRPGGDDAALFEAFCAAFAEHWGAEHPDRTVWWWDERDAPDAGYDPTLWSVVRHGDQIVAFVLARTRERQGRREGYVSQIGVRPGWRGRRLGQVLLASTLKEFAARGLAAASLDVDADNVTDALRLYRSVGMTAEPAFTIWGADIEG